MIISIEKVSLVLILSMFLSNDESTMRVEDSCSFFIVSSEYLIICFSILDEIFSLGILEYTFKSFSQSSPIKFAISVAPLGVLLSTDILESVDEFE